jgi:hypothetical protein
MNVNMQSNISMMSSMVGIPQQTGQTKQVNKDLDQGQQITDTDKTEGTREQDKEKSNVQNQGGKTQGVAKHQTHAVQRRFVAEDHQEEKKTKEGKSDIESQDLLSKQETKGKLMLDTSSQIQHRFAKFQMLQQQQQATNQKRLKPEIQRRVFAENLRKWVDVEYKQFVKQNDPLYTRRNLREILQALGEQESPQAKKTKLERDTAGKNKTQYTKYNKYNITQASKAMRIFEEIPSNIEHLDYDLVA